MADAPAGLRPAARRDAGRRDRSVECGGSRHHARHAGTGRGNRRLQCATGGAAGRTGRHLNRRFARQRSEPPPSNLQWRFLLAKAAMTDLIDYLSRNFLSEARLLAAAGIDAPTLQDLQVRRMAPLPAYRLRLAMHCDSFFGHYAEEHAAKEWAAGTIEAIIAPDGIDAGDEHELVTLRHAVDTLDAASSPFAPHERERSSRRRLVDRVREQYRL